MKQLSFFNHIHDQQFSDDSPLCAYWKLFVDGASRNNPGPSGAGIYVMKNDCVVQSVGYFLGIKTNNQAEYLALVIGLLHMREQMKACDKLMIISDSQLVIRQLAGEYKVRHEHVKQLHRVAITLLSEMQYTLMHVLRDDNTHADHLSNVGIDTHNNVPAHIVHALKQYGVLL